MAAKRITPAAILDKAIELAELTSWEEVRLYRIAEALDISLSDVKRHFPDKEALVNAWFDRADEAMWRTTQQSDFYLIPLNERLHALIMSRLLAFENHRRVTKQMLRGRLDITHPHTALAAFLRLQRAIQWLREAAQSPDMGLKARLEEQGLGLIYLMAFCVWFKDNSENYIKTRGFVTRQLDRASQGAHWAIQLRSLFY